MVGIKLLTLSVHRKLQILDLPITPKDLMQMVLIDIFGESLNHDLRGVSRFGILLGDIGWNTFELIGAGGGLLLAVRE